MISRREWVFEMGILTYENGPKIATKIIYTNYICNFISIYYEILLKFIFNISIPSALAKDCDKLLIFCDPFCQ
jgi:hypothetical protein